MKNKHKLLIVLAGILIVSAIGLNFSQLTGYLVGSQPQNEGNIHVAVLKADVKIIPKPGEPGVYLPYQKYQIRKNEECIKDCAFYCKETGLEYLRAYVRTWGECLCKCVKAS